DQLNAQRLQRPVMQVVAAVLAGGLNVSEQPGGWRGQCPERRAETGRLVQPAHDVSPAGSARGPGRPATGEKHLTPELAELFRDLTAGLTATNDQNPSGRKCRRVPVPLRVEDRYIRGEFRAEWRPVRALVRAGADDHRVRGELVVGGVEQETPAWPRLKAANRNAGAYWQVSCVLF